MTSNTATELARFNMIEQQVRPWDVSDPKVLDVMQKVARETFVPEIHQKLAFGDIEIPIGHGETMMSPKLEGRLLQSLDIQEDDEIFELGTGSGFLTACLATLGNHVHSIELHEGLSFTAANRLDENHILNVTLSVADGSIPWQGSPAQFDKVAITASIPEYSDQFESLIKPGGRLFIVVGNAPVMKALLVSKSESGEISKELVLETCLAPIRGMEQATVFSF